MPIVRLFRLFFAVLLAGLMLQPAGADERDDFQAALEDASARCRTALQILETESQQNTAAAVHRFRQSWQRVMDRHGAIRTDTRTEDAALFLDVDMRIIGVILVIDLGNRDAARSALEAIDNKLTEFGARSLAPER
jgi:hypothetical protein